MSSGRINDQERVDATDGRAGEAAFQRATRRRGMTLGAVRPPRGERGVEPVDSPMQECQSLREAPGSKLWRKLPSPWRRGPDWRGARPAVALPVGSRTAGTPSRSPESPVGERGASKGRGEVDQLDELRSPDRANCAKATARARIVRRSLGCAPIVPIRDSRRSSSVSQRQCLGSDLPPPIDGRGPSPWSGPPPSPGRHKKRSVSGDTERSQSVGSLRRPSPGRSHRPRQPKCHTSRRSGANP